MSEESFLQDGAPAVPELDEAIRPSYIVGIGASAGGLEALEELFEKMPAQTGMAFIVVQHLSPDFKSLTNVLLARRTSIPIHCVENDMEVRADAIYLIPPKMDMIIANGKLLLTDKDPTQLMTMPIDHFLRSVAQEAGDRSIGVILSGTGSDGSRGIREIHDAGGLVLVQKPESAKFDGMPNSAEKTGVVDFFLTPGEIPEALAKYSIRREKGDMEQTCASREPGEQGIATLFRILREAYGIDFSHYRPPTVERRIERRLQLNGSTSLAEYTHRLEENPDEVNALYKDLLIGVTRFMRDTEAFTNLTSVLPQLVQQAAEKNEEFRVWVAGCATGEEAYSIAILIRECLEALGNDLPVKIFATDVHRTSLEFASLALYPESSLADMSRERLQRHFIRKGDSFQAAPELRKMIVFAAHNVIKDAPFTKLHLVTCRNLLIYLQPNSQKKVLSLFHFGLKTGGILFLGPSESAGELSDEFELVDSRWKILRKRRDLRLSADIRVATPAAPYRARLLGVSSPLAGLMEGQLFTAYNFLLGKYMPPSLLVNGHREVVQSFAGANRYLKHKEGLYSSDILDMVDPDLRTALTGALQRVLNDRKPVAYKAVRITLPDRPALVNVTVEPVALARSGDCFALISLQELDEKAASGAPAVEVIKLDQASQEQLTSLESELRFTKENLQATIEELETSNEELQATNEELVAANEELQSTNEELHSVNEELYTVNAEYQNKITQLTELTTDVENLLTSTDVHTVFLDDHLRIRKFTPQIAETFNFLPQDVGRRIDSFTHTIDHPGLLEDLHNVLQTGVPVEKQVRDQKGNWFLLRVLPYRVGLNVDGVVLTLIDIAVLKRLEAEAGRKQQQLVGILNNSPNPISISDCDGRYVITDGSFRHMVGCDAVGKTPREVFPAQTAEVLSNLTGRVISDGSSVQAEVSIEHPDGPHTYLSILFPLQDEQGRTSGVGNIMTDVTRLKVAECRALEAVTQRDRFLAMLSHELRNPLSAILNAANAMERAGGGDGGDWLQIIERRSRHMARLLDDLLDVARLTQNKFEIRKKVFDLATTVADVVEETRAMLERKRIHLSVNRSDVPMLVDGDPARLQQIQVNLLVNAAKYTSEGGHIWYSVQREEDQAVIRVRDNGVGIPPDMLGKVFELFVQADAKLEQPAGIGVGLTMVRSIVEMHCGRVKAYSEGPGKGSEFIVWLPLARSEAREANPQPAPIGVARPDPRLAGCKILIVEDDADIRETLRSILQHDRFEVRAVSDGPSALAALQESLPDVALLDLGLPGMSGYELARRIRQQFGENSLQLVALTGYGRSSDRQATKDAGFDAHLTKPLKSMELYQTLASLFLGGHAPATSS